MGATVPDERGRLYADDIAARIGIEASDWRARVSRGYAPAPNGYVNTDGVVRAVWEPTEIEAYIAKRSVRLAGREQEQSP